MATELIYFSSDESEYSTPNSTPDHYTESHFGDSYNAVSQLIASQLEQRSIIGAATVPYPLTPNASMTSGNDEQHNPTPIFGKNAPYTSYTPQRHHHPIQLCQQLQPTSDTPIVHPGRSRPSRHFSSLILT